MGSNGRIFKNTIYLYTRMAVLMLVRLYTVRVVLQVLGTDNYGLWNTIMAFVTAFTIISPTLTSSTQRFLNYDMGKGGQSLSRIFSVSMEFFILLAVGMVLLLETFGIWFLNSKMNIPPGMDGQANWVFQFCILTLIVNTLRLPYEACIIASEKMSFYALICMVEGVVLLGIVYLLEFVPADIRLASYGGLTLAAQSVIALFYVVYARRRFGFARFSVERDRKLIREMASFSGWSIFGSLAGVLAVEGVNILINIYFGVAVNAAYGICLQIFAAANIIVYNINKASAPRIIKDYSSGEMDEMRTLVLNISKFSFLLILMIIVPAVFNMSEILHIWLGDDEPPLAALFSMIILVNVLENSFAPAAENAINATGKIHGYQIWMGALISLDFFIPWALFRMGFDAVSAIWTRVAVEVVIGAVRIGFMQRRIALRTIEYVKRTFLPSMAMAVIAVAIMAGLWHYSAGENPMERMVVTTLVFLPLYLVAAAFVGFTNNQRKAILSNISARLSKK